jgi:hypothetical protein
MSNIKKEHLSQIKAYKGEGEMDADNYLKHLYFGYRDDHTGNIISRKGGINSIRYGGLSHTGLRKEESIFICLYHPRASAMKRFFVSEQLTESGPIIPLFP